MARPSKDFLFAWGSLAGDDQESGWRTIPIDAAGTVLIRAGRRFPGNEEAVLFHFSTASIPATEALPNGQGFSVDRADPHNDGSMWLALTRRPNGSPELFGLMACDVVGALDASAADGGDQSRLARVFLGRVRAWQEFMRKGARALSPEAEIGLVGELAVLTAIMAAGVPSHVAIESWVGPLDQAQDFEIGTGAIEVKATISTLGFPARIGSLEQLDDAVRQPLFVAGVKLKQLAAGHRLPDFVEAVKISAAPDPEAARAFSERLVAAGYFDSHADTYIRRFEVVGIHNMEVGPGFPRLVRSSVPEAVTRAAYDIDLDKAAAHAVPDISAALKKLGAI